MRTRTVIAALGTIMLAGFASCMWGAETTANPVSGGGFTVSYPTGTEKQAKRVLDVAKESIGPSLDINKRIIALLDNSESLSKDIASLLGYPEMQDKARTYLVAYKQRSEALVACFSHIKLVKKADAVAAGGVDAGILQVSYDKSKDEFNMLVNLDKIEPDKLKASYFPVFLNTDGTVRAENKLGEMAVDFMGSNKAMIIAPVHETVASIMAKNLNLYQPFARWFSDGVSGWITRQVVSKADPKLTVLANDLFSPNANSAKYRDKINFLAWPQRAFQNLRSAEFDPVADAAHTQYAIAFVSDVLGRDGAQNLPKIMREVNFNANADTQTILNAIKKVIGKDVKPMFMTYVPQTVRDGIASDEPTKLLVKAEALAGDKKWADAAAKIKLALQMTPEDVNARLNCAAMERESGQKLDAEIQVFLAARLLQQGNHSFHMYGDTLESNYVVARFAILMGNLEYAKKFLAPVLQAKPDHQDAIKAMEEIKALENAAGVPPPSTK